jgi:four helix bundle protein
MVGDLKERTLKFGEMTLHAVASLPNAPSCWMVARQLGRAGTSIGANVWEADVALTEADFANKVGIARKEANETQYWLELGRRCDMLSSDWHERLMRSYGTR